MVMMKHKCKICGAIVAGNGSRQIRDAMFYHLQFDDDLHRNAVHIVKEQRRKYKEELSELNDKYQTRDYSDCYEDIKGDGQ